MRGGPSTLRTSSSVAAHERKLDSSRDGWVGGRNTNGDTVLALICGSRRRMQKCVEWHVRRTPSLKRQVFFGATIPILAKGTYTLLDVLSNQNITQLSSPFTYHRISHQHTIGWLIAPVVVYLATTCFFHCASLASLLSSPCLLINNPSYSILHYNRGRYVPIR